MNTPKLLFVLLIMMAGSVAVLTIAEPTIHASFDHPSLPANTMSQASDGLVRHQNLIWPATFYGITVSLFVVACLPLGLNQRHRNGRGANLLRMYSLIYALLFAAVVVLYWRFLPDNSFDVLGFPVASAWMLFVFGVAPVVLMTTYLVTFSKCVMTDEDLQRFQQIVQQRQSNADTRID